VSSAMASNKIDVSCQYGGTVKGGTKVVKSQTYNAKEKKGPSGKEEGSLSHNTNNNNVKYGSTTAQKANKKSQFSINLNLKQKFCSMFRFRRSHQQPQQSTDGNQQQQQSVDANGVYGMNGSLAKGPEDGKLPKFSSRALPPLPGKKSADSLPVPADLSMNEPKDEPKDANSDFPASIQKVKEVRAKIV